MRKIGLSALALTTVMALSSCSNTSSNQSNTTSLETANHDHDHSHEGHDHDGHDHADHNHAHATSTEASSNTTVQQGQPAATIPLFKFYKVKSGVSFTNEDIPKNKKTAFILFDPNCSHCRTEAGQIGKNYAKIKDMNLYFV